MRLPLSLRVALYASALVLFASGAAWLLRRSSVLMQVHGAAAMAFLALAGALTALHTGQAWRERRNLPSGVAMAVGLVALTVTGWLLYYLGDEAARAASSNLHWWLGLALPLLIGWHIASARASRTT